MGAMEVAPWRTGSMDINGSILTSFSNQLLRWTPTGALEALDPQGLGTVGYRAVPAFAHHRSGATASTGPTFLASLSEAAESRQSQQPLSAT